jgi:hypothetical protein
MTAVRVDTTVEVDELGDYGGQGDVQAIDIIDTKGVKVRIVNVYDQKLQENNNRPSDRLARAARWGEIINKENVVVCGDFNAHSPWWNSRCSQRREANFLEGLILQFDLEVINDGQPTRVATRANESIELIIEITLIRGDAVSDASARTMNEESEEIDSDHRMIKIE